MVAALLALFWPVQKILAGRGVDQALLEGEAADELPIVIDRRVKKVDPLILRELRIQGDSQESVFLRRGHGERTDLGDQLGLRIEDLHLPGDLDKEDPAVRRLLHRHGLRKAFGKDLKMEPVVLGRRRLSRKGPKAGDAKRGADKSETKRAGESAHCGPHSSSDFKKVQCQSAAAESWLERKHPKASSGGTPGRPEGARKWCGAFAIPAGPPSPLADGRMGSWR